MEEILKTLKDKYYIVYTVFLLQGIAILIPFNMFTTSNDYFVNFKMVLHNNASDKSYYQRLFLQDITIASILPQLFIIWANVFLPLKGGKNVMVICCLTVEIFLFLFTDILAMVDSTSWTPAFFWLTILMVALLNMSNGFYQSIIFGLAAKLPPKYVGAVVLGNNSCGIFASLIAIAAHFITSNLQAQGVYYFITALAVLMACLDTFLTLPLNKYYSLNELADKKLEAMSDRSKKLSTKIPYWEIYKKAFLQLVNVFFMYAVSYSIYPSILANVKECSNTHLFGSTYMFMYITCFLTFGIFATVGSWIATIFRWPSKKYLIIPVFVRFLLIPFFLFSNYQVHGIIRILPVYVANDWIYWIGSAVMAFTYGYWSSVALQYVPACVNQRYAYIAGKFGSATLMSGIFFGVMSTYIWPKLINTTD